MVQSKSQFGSVYMMHPTVEILSHNFISDMTLLTSFKEYPRVTIKSFAFGTFHLSNLVIRLRVMNPLALSNSLPKKAQSEIHKCNGRSKCLPYIDVNLTENALMVYGVFLFY